MADRIIAVAPGAPALMDDRPFNEYFFLRHLLARARRMTQVRAARRHLNPPRGLERDDGAVDPDHLD
ncbi:MAG TPA: hypothetical protein VFT43_06255 [Candidatus Polarisedimenticolia bacterium]|nr:hypothetical protein [Candidatus Polarisedimenticolia bacterium]